MSESHGNAEQAHQFATDEIDDLYDRLEFLKEWVCGGSLDAEYDDYYPWLMAKRGPVTVEHVQTGSVCERRNGDVCVVTGITNASGPDNSQFPITVNYLDVKRGAHWSRPWAEFKRKFHPVVDQMGVPVVQPNMLRLVMPVSAAPTAPKPAATE